MPGDDINIGCPVSQLMLLATAHRHNSGTKIYFKISDDLFYETCRLYILHILFDFWGDLKRVGSVLSRSELDPFLYAWYHTVRTKSGLSPCEMT